MKVLTICMAIMFAFAGTIQQDKPVLLSIDVKYQDGQYINHATIENKTDEVLKGTFVFTLDKMGASTSSTKQSGDFILKAAEEKILSRSSINMNAGDSAYCKLLVKIGDMTYETTKILRPEN